MAVLSRVNFIGQQRLDLHHLLANDSYTAFDFRTIIAGIVGSDKTYIVKGFQVVGQSGLAINIKVADALVYNPKDPNGCMYTGLSDEPDEIVILPASQSNVFVEAVFKNESQAPVNSGFWDPLALFGDDAGGTEFTASANTQNVVVLEIKVNTSGFTEGAIPLLKANTGASSINSMEDRRQLLYRLGTGGTNPNPLNKYNFSPNRAEPVTVGNGTGDTNPQSPWRSKDSVGAINDKGLESFKDWADAVMTRISEVAGSTIWYASGVSTSVVSNLSLSQTFFDNDSGHSIQPSPTSSFKWSRIGGNLVLSGEGTVPIEAGEHKVGLTRWQSNYSIVEWHLGRAFVSATNRSYVTSGDGIRWKSPAPVNGGNIYLSLEREVSKGSGNNVSWQDNSAETSYNPNRAVSGVAGDFTGIANGDYIRKDSEGLSRYYRVVSMSDGSTVFPDTGATRNKVADSTIVALLLDRDISSGASFEPLKFFRSRYSEADLVADTVPGIYNFQDANRYWLGRRIDNNFILRNYGTMQEGEEIPTLNDAFDIGGGGAADISLVHNEVAVFDSSNNYTLKSGSGNLITLKRRIRNNTVDIPSAGDNSGSLLEYTIAAPVGLINAGESIWVRLSDTVGGALTNGSVTPTADDNSNELNTMNRWEVRTAANSPLRNWDNRNVFLLARRVTIDGDPALLFFDGTIIGRFGKVINQDTDFRGNVRIHDAPTNALPFFSTTDAGVIKWDAANLFWTEGPNTLTVRNTVFGNNVISQVTPANFQLLSNLGPNTLVIGQANSTTYIPGDLIVDGTVSAFATDDLYVEDKLISLGVGVPLNGGFGSGIEIADDTKTSASIDTTNTQIYVDLTFASAHGYTTGNLIGVSAKQDVGGITAGQISGEYTVVATGSAVGDAEVISPTILRIWTKGTATSTATSSTDPPKVFIKPYSLRLGSSDGTYSGLTSWVFRVKAVATAPTITPVANYGIIATSHSVNMLATRIPFVNDDNAGPSGVDTTLNYSNNLTWNNSTNTLTATNIVATNLSPTTLNLTNQVTVTSNTTLTTSSSIVRVNTFSALADITITLPPANSSNNGQVIIIKDVGGAVSQLNKRVIVAPNGTDTILSGQPDPLVMDIDYFALILVSDGAGSWLVI
jgi:hypothetical protein